MEDKEEEEGEGEEEEEEERINIIKQKPLIGICDHLMIELALLHQRFAVFICVRVKCTASYFLVLFVRPEGNGEVGREKVVWLSFTGLG